MLAMAKTSDDDIVAGIRLTTRTALKRAEPISLPPRAPDDRRTQEERQQAAEEAEMLSIGLAQRARVGAGRDDKELSEPLGRFCKLHGLGRHCWLAGIRLEEIIREARAAQGLPVPDSGRGLTDNPALSCLGTCYPSQCAASNSLCPRVRKEAALMQLRESNEILIVVMPRAPSVLEKLVFYKAEPSPHDGGVIKHGLVRLANRYGFSPRRFGD